MNRATAIVAGALALCIAVPSFGSHRGDPYDEARYELSLLDRDVDRIRHPVLRQDLGHRIDRLEQLVERMERREDRARNGRGRGHGHGHQSYRGLPYGEAMAMVQNEPFDSGKIEAIRRVARNGRYSTEEAANLANQCTFESCKIDALIALYPSVTDPYRYYSALRILTFSSSRRRVESELNL